MVQGVSNIVNYIDPTGIYYMVILEMGYPRCFFQTNYFTNLGDSIDILNVRVDFILDQYQSEIGKKDHLEIQFRSYD